MLSRFTRWNGWICPGDLMGKRIRIVNFKSLADVTVELDAGSYKGRGQ